MKKTISPPRVLVSCPLIKDPRGGGASGVLRLRLHFAGLAAIGLTGPQAARMPARGTLG